jgi:Tryptophan-associated transmembrane protein (Trp_oprn_chp)
MSDGALRTLGFATTAAGALIAGVGATIVWITIGFRGDVEGVLDSEFAGTDLAEGVAVLALAAATLVALLAVRRAGGRARAIAATAIVVFGIAIVLLASSAAIRAEDRAIDEAARTIATSTDISIDEAADRVRTEPDLALDVVTSGVVVSIAGGALVVLGGAMSLGWVRRAERTAAAPQM